MFGRSRSKPVVDGAGVTFEVRHLGDHNVGGNDILSYDYDVYEMSVYQGSRRVWVHVFSRIKRLTEDGDAGVRRSAEWYWSQEVKRREREATQSGGLRWARPAKIVERAS